jgi:formamidopyrimidine-DNA glycosylase
MPELPEVETVRRGLAPVLEGSRITGVMLSGKKLRLPLPERFAERLAGRRVAQLARRGKFLLAALDGEETLIMHLGMSGSFLIINGGERPDAPPAGGHIHVVFGLESGETIEYRDPRRFGLMVLADNDGIADHAFFARMGPEPLGNEFNAAYLAGALSGRQTSLKAALLDQHVVAGLGNIYVCEALHAAGLSPKRMAASLGRGGERAERLVHAVREVLEAAIAAGGSSLKDHARADGSLGYFQHNFAVYGRGGEKCRHQGCGGTIRRIVQNGRSSFYCPSCQR